MAALPNAPALHVVNGNCLHEGEHYCNRCRQWKPENQFRAYSRTNNIPRPECRECATKVVLRSRKNNPEGYKQTLERAKARTDAYGLTQRRREKLKRQYGMTPEEFAKKLAEQNNACAICAAPFTDIADVHTDHDNETGKTRDLLCRHCNSGLGHFRDDPERLIAAAEYIKQHRGE